jgi:hypothetical protein
MFFLLKEIFSVTAVLRGIIYAIGPDTESTQTALFTVIFDNVDPVC